MIEFDFPSLRQLRAFAFAGHLESFGKAAQELHLSQPCITQAVGRLETQLRVSLFERRHTGSYLTTSGAILLRRVTRFFDQIRSALCEPAVGNPFVERAFVEALESKITTPQIRSLIAIADNHSLDSAARKLGLSQPSVHRSARELERILRRTLFRRTAIGITTTPQGTDLARRFKIAAREVEYGLAELQTSRGVFNSRVVVGNIPHSETHLLSATINELLTLHPKAKVQILDSQYDTLLEGLRAGTIDILFGILRKPSQIADVDEEPLFSNPYAVVARRGHPLFSVKKITLDHLRSYTWIMPGMGTPRRQAFERLFEGHPPNVSIETTSIDIYKSVLATSDRITLMSEMKAKLDQNSELEVLPFRSPDLIRTDGIATRAGWKPTEIHTRFIGLLRDQVRQAL
jgi:DNA-binding transcriptional LysR family regulator